MLKRLFNYYIRPLDVEVKYSEGTKFKITITTDGKLRVKIPRDTDSNVERQWIDRCKAITKYFILHPYDRTLRGETRYENGVFTLFTNGRRLGVFRVYGITLEHA